MEDKVKQAIELLTSIAESTTPRSSSTSLSTRPSQHGVRHGASGSCSRAVEALRSVRERLQLQEGTSSREQLQGGTSSTEQKANFAPYERKSSTGKHKSWTVKLVCLSSTEAKKVPCSVYDRNVLASAGLGEKKTVIPDIECSAKDFNEIIISSFSKLNGCGGFELLRCVPNTKDLELISPVIAASPKVLKSVIGNGRVFIRPIQKSLDVNPIKAGNSELKEKCLHCDIKVPVCDLRAHVNICRWKKSSLIRGLESDSDSDFEVLIPPERPPLSLKRELDWDSNDTSPPPKKPTSESLISISSESDNDVEQTEQEMIDRAISLSKNNSSEESIATIADVLKSLTKYVMGEEVTVTVRRENILDDALRTVRRGSFPVDHTIIVEFLGEAGEDGGGLKREFWCLLFKRVKSSLFEGVGDRLVPRHDIVALQNKKFEHVGNLIAMGLLQGSSGVPFIAPPVYEYLCGVSAESVNVSVEDVPTYEVKEYISQIEAADCNESLRQACQSDINTALEAGYTKPIACITMSDKPGLVNALLLHFVVYRNKAVLDQLRAGLNILGMREAMSKYSEILKPFFVQGMQPPLSGNMIRSLIGDVHFSETGSSELVKEKASYMLFLDMLHNIQDGGSESGLSFGRVLNFFTGSEYPPALGFDSPVSIHFSSTSNYPLASTCALQLTLPTKFHDDELRFNENMEYGILNHGGFGMC